MKVKAGDKVALVGSEQEEPEPEMERSRVTPSTPSQRIVSMTSAVMRGDAVQEIFNLDEGQVTLTFPASLSSESYQDLEDRLEIVLRGLKRRVVKPAQAEAGYKIDLDDE
jgi:hypothetical protein